jgi:hypothetical protein
VIVDETVAEKAENQPKQKPKKKLAKSKRRS